MAEAEKMTAVEIVVRNTGKERVRLKRYLDNCKRKGGGQPDSGSAEE